MNKPVYRVLSVILLMGLTACESQGAMIGEGEMQGNGNGNGNESGSVVEESEEVNVNDEMLGELELGNSLFAYDLYEQLRLEDGNIFFSPLSISTAMGMTYAGARNETMRQMAESMHFILPGEALHPAFSTLMKDLSARDESGGSEGFQLNMANALWGQEGYGFLEPFVQLLNTDYDAGLREVDFAADAKTARRLINDWVADQTEERIKDLIPDDVLNELTRLVLTNAVYFNAAWQQPFDENLTVEDNFTLLDGDQISVPMMQLASDFRYAGMDGYQVVDLPYQGGDFSMFVLLPDDGAFRDFEEALSYEMIEEAIDSLEMTNLALRMPSFESASAFDLSQTLSAMGIVDAFNMDADFSGMDGTTELFISAVMHQANVSVDEAGTEAAAATAVVMQLKAVMQPPVEVSIDRPFLFLIRDNQTGTILFMGRILNPAG